MKKILALLLIMLIIFPQNMAFAYEDVMDYIDSEDAFLSWIDNHPDGGSISLGIDITIKTHIMLSGPLYIDTGSHGIIFDGGSIYYPLTITGEGVDVPVLTIINPGFRTGSWDYALPAYNITARGLNGVGGVAVHINTDKNGTLGFNDTKGLIRSEGAGAIGVLFDSPVDAHYLTISVEGEDAAAIYSQDGVNLYYSIIKADGPNSNAAIGNNILFDACNISADTTGTDVINRKIIALAGSWLYWPLLHEQDLSDSDLYYKFYFITTHSFLLSGDETHPAVVRPLYVMWDQDMMENINTSVIENTVIPGSLCDVYQGLGLEEDFSLDLNVDVQDGTKPCITSLYFNVDIDSDRNYVIFNTSFFIYPSLESEHGDYILWRSDDYGQSWYDFSKSSDVKYSKNAITYYYDEIIEPVLFCIQEDGGEFSNIVEIYGYEGKTYGLLGGDRTGVDRDGETILTKPSLPAPETPTPIPTQAPEPTQLPEPTQSPIPTPIPTPIPEPTPVPTPMPVPTPTSPPIPTHTPIPPSVSEPTLSPIPTKTSELTHIPSEVPAQDLTVPIVSPVLTPIPELTITPIPTQLPVSEPTPSPEPIPALDDNSDNSELQAKSEELSGEENDTVEIQTESILLPPSESVLPQESIQSLIPEDDTMPYTKEPSITVPNLPHEWEDDKTIAISGKRLKLMMTMGETITFIKNGISLSINTTFLEELDIKDEQLITIVMDDLEAEQYMLSVMLDEEELYGLSCVVSFNGDEYDMSISGIVDFIEILSESDIDLTQTPSQVIAAMQPLPSSNGDEDQRLVSDKEDKRIPTWIALGFTFIGTGCAFGGIATIINKIRK